MGFHNPFLKDGLIKFPDNGSLVKHVEKWAKVRGDKLAYRFLDFSVERDGVARELNWADFGARNRAVAARLQQVTEPGDRVAILCPQNLEYVVAMFGALYSGRIAVPLFDPSEPGHVGRLHASPGHGVLPWLPNQQRLGFALRFPARILPRLRTLPFRPFQVDRRRRGPEQHDTARVAGQRVLGGP